MVCVPCILIPFFLFLWRFIQPLVLKIWNPFEKKNNENVPKDITECSMFSSCPCIKKDKIQCNSTDKTQEEIVDTKKQN
ncbi:hypothetical protein PGB90_006623 [Kerria lacca]